MAVSATSFAQTTQPTAAEQMNAVKASVAEKATVAKEATKRESSGVKSRFCGKNGDSKSQNRII
ncbi:hypothetical protein [Mannheimia haemolytica]|uniref:hypothetical protein n=1 Tax=Mannheimia haemolytica TaxID=75985 RepID=UPI0038F7E9AE